MWARFDSGLNSELKSSPVSAATALASAGLQPRAPLSSRPHAPATRRTTCLSCMVQYASSAADAMGTSEAASVAPLMREAAARSLTTTNPSGNARQRDKQDEALDVVHGRASRRLRAAQHLRDRVLETEVGVLVADALVTDEELRREHRQRVGHGPAQALVQPGS